MAALNALAGEPRWVAWRNELRGSKPTKVPYAPNGKKAKSDDPSTWGTRKATEARAPRIINGLGGGIGIQLGDLGGHMHLAGLDLDSCLAKDRALAPWAAEIISAVPTYTERSPSGRGLKMFFYTAREDVRPFLDRIGVRPDAWGARRSVPGQNGRDHGPAVEVYFAGRYFAVTEDVWPGTPDTLATLDDAALDRLSRLIPPAKPASGKGRNGGDNSRSAAAYRMGMAMRRAGRSFEEFSAAVRTNPRTANWHVEKGIADGGRELYRIWQKAGAKTEIPRAEWLSGAQCDRQGEPRPNLYNAMLALREDARVSDLFSYDGMLRAAILHRPVPAAAMNGEREPFEARPVRDADVTAL